MQKRVFSKRRNSRDLMIQLDFLQGITLDESQNTQQPFSQRKSNQIDSKSRNTNLSKRVNLRGKKEEKGEEMRDSILQPYGPNQSHKNEHKIISKPRGTHLYKIQKVQVFILPKFYKQREGKGENQKGQQGTHENLLPNDPCLP